MFIGDIYYGYSTSKSKEMQNIAFFQPFGYLIPRMKKENLGERRTECLGRKLCSSYKGKEHAYGKGGYSHQSLYEKK